MSTGPAFPPPRPRGRGSGPQAGPLFSGLGRGRAEAVLVTLRGCPEPCLSGEEPQILLRESVRVVLAHSEPQRADPVGRGLQEGEKGSAYGDLLVGKSPLPSRTRCV